MSIKEEKGHNKISKDKSIADKKRKNSGWSLIDAIRITLKILAGAFIALFVIVSGFIIFLITNGPISSNKLTHFVEYVINDAIDETNLKIDIPTSKIYWSSTQYGIVVDFRKITLSGAGDVVNNLQTTTSSSKDTVNMPDIGILILPQNIFAFDTNNRVITIGIKNYNIDVSKITELFKKVTKEKLEAKNDELMDQKSSDNNVNKNSVEGLKEAVEETINQAFSAINEHLNNYVHLLSHIYLENINFYLPIPKELQNPAYVEAMQAECQKILPKNDEKKTISDDPLTYVEDASDLDECARLDDDPTYLILSFDSLTIKKAPVAKRLEMHARIFIDKKYYTEVDFYLNLDLPKAKRTEAEGGASQTKRDPAKYGTAEANENELLFDGNFKNLSYDAFAKINVPAVQNLNLVFNFWFRFYVNNDMSMKEVTFILLSDSGNIKNSEYVGRDVHLKSLEINGEYLAKEELLNLYNFSLNDEENLDLYGNFLYDMKNKDSTLKLFLSKIPLNEFYTYWPDKYGKGAKDWLQENLRDGVIPSADMTLSVKHLKDSKSQNLPLALGQGITLDANVKIEGAKLTYDYPNANKHPISIKAADLHFSNDLMSAEIHEAEVHSLNLNNFKIEIPSIGSDQQNLNIQGEVSGNLQDALKETVRHIYPQLNLKKLTLDAIKHFQKNHGNYKNKKGKEKNDDKNDGNQDQGDQTKDVVSMRELDYIEKLIDRGSGFVLTKINLDIPLGVESSNMRKNNDTNNIIAKKKSTKKINKDKFELSESSESYESSEVLNELRNNTQIYSIVSNFKMNSLVGNEQIESEKFLVIYDNGIFDVDGPLKIDNKHEIDFQLIKVLHNREYSPMYADRIAIDEQKQNNDHSQSLKTIKDRINKSANDFNNIINSDLFSKSIANFDHIEDGTTEINVKFFNISLKDDIITRYTNLSNIMLGNISGTVNSKITKENISIYSDFDLSKTQILLSQLHLDKPLDVYGNAIFQFNIDNDDLARGLKNSKKNTDMLEELSHSSDLLKTLQELNVKYEISMPNIYSSGEALYSLVQNKILFINSDLTNLDKSSFQFFYDNTKDVQLITISGESFDMSAFSFDEFNDVSKTSNTTFRNKKFSIATRLNKIYLKNDQIITNPIFNISYDGERFGNLYLGGSFPSDSGYFTIFYDHPVLAVTSNNAGRLFKAFGLYNNMQYGIIDLRAEVGKNYVFDGDLVLGNFNISHAPIFSELLKLASITSVSLVGIFDIFNIGGMHFNYVTCKVSSTIDQIDFSSCDVNGQVINLKGNGFINFQDKEIAFRGFLAPVQLLDMLVNLFEMTFMRKKLTIYDLIKQREARTCKDDNSRVNFTIQGHTDGKVDVKVNPLSIIAPGFLGYLFASKDDGMIKKEEKKEEEKGDSQVIKSTVSNDNSKNIEGSVKLGNN